LPFGGFFLPWNPEWEMSTSLDETSSLRKIVGSLPETLPVVLLFKTLPIYHSKQAIPRLFAGMAHFYQP
jgi:hypothetical protein